MSKVLAIGDTHFKYHSPVALAHAFEAAKVYKPDIIIQVGDLYDMYSFSKFPKSAIISPFEEVKDSVALAAKFWKTLQKAAPKAECYQLMGNHDARIDKRIQEKMPEMAALFKGRSLLEFPGVETMESDRDFLEIDGVIYVHGWFSKSIDHAKYFNKPVVHGHRHRPCIETQGRLWSMDCGFLADEHSLPLSYGMSKLTHWSNALGLVEDGTPNLVLLGKQSK